jgi:hypothetical protein
MTIVVWILTLWVGLSVSVLVLLVLGCYISSLLAKRRLRLDSNTFRRLRIRDRMAMHLQMEEIRMLPEVGQPDGVFMLRSRPSQHQRGDFGRSGPTPSVRVATDGQVRGRRTRGPSEPI